MMTPIITTDILQRTFRLLWDNRTGTCFTIDVDGRQYLITARHIVEPISGLGTVQIFHDNSWKHLQVELVGHGRQGIDITVLAPRLQLSPAHQLHATIAGVVISQDVYFLGFPYGLTNEVGKLNNKFPLPLVKKAIVSAIQFGDVKTLLLDGHNNPGFSGGPVVCRRVEDRQGVLTVIGVVSGYVHTSEPVYDSQSVTALSYKYNTGIISAYAITHAIDLIHVNPIGFKLSSGASAE